MSQYARARVTLVVEEDTDPELPATIARRITELLAADPGLSARHGRLWHADNAEVVTRAE